MLPSAFDKLFSKPSRPEKGGLLTSVPSGKFGNSEHFVSVWKFIIHKASDGHLKFSNPGDCAVPPDIAPWIAESLDV